MANEYWEKFTRRTKEGKLIGDGVLFEDLVKNLLTAKYGVIWTRTAKSHDDNRDYWAIINQNRIWAECKNYSESIAMDILAPTLVMAQVYDVNTILFFSKSVINKNAKSKILAFGEKSKKSIYFFDGETLEQLIWDLQDKLPKKFKPLGRDNFNRTLEPHFELKFSQTAITNAFAEDERFVNIENADRVRYNEIFGLKFFISNPRPDAPLDIKISIATESVDRNYFDYLNADISVSKNTWFEKRLDGGASFSITLNVRPIIFKQRLQLPNFEIDANYATDNTAFRQNFKQVVVDCAWIGKTKIIGRQYERILTKTKEQLIGNSDLSILMLTGSSGTGKTRLLSECEIIFLKYGYTALKMNSLEDYNAGEFFREIISFLYEIPTSEIIEQLEEQSLENNKKLFYDSNASVAIKMLREVLNAKTDENYIRFIKEYGELLIEKLSNQKCVLIVDNVQFADQTIQEFLRRYTITAVNRSRPTFSVLLIAFNSDFMTSSASGLLFDIAQSDAPHILSEKITGFNEPEIGLLFLRELVRVSDGRYDGLFKEIISRVSLNPYHLFQTIKYLEENNAVRVTPNDQGYIIEDDSVWKCISVLSDGVTGVLEKRWNYLRSSVSEEKLFQICSVLYLFDRLDQPMLDIFSIEREDIEYLVKKNFLCESDPKVYAFDHDIIRTFFVRQFEAHSLDCLTWLSMHGNPNLIRNNRPIYSLYKICIEQDHKYTFDLIYSIQKTVIPPRVAAIFYKELFYHCINIEYLYDNKTLWIEHINDICKLIRETSGSIVSLGYYVLGRSTIHEALGKTAYEECAPSYRPFLHFYTDVLVELHYRDDAEELISSVLSETEKTEPKSQECADEICALRAIMLNRQYVAYNNEYPTLEVKSRRKSLLSKSRNIAPKIEKAELRRLIEYLNDSDEGYNYYGYYKDLNKLMTIWNRCFTGMPEAAPEKTLNYYRKKIQYDLIQQNFNATLEDIKKGRDYLLNGEYSHEPLIFNTFFLMAEIMAYLQSNPSQNTHYINKLLTELTKIQQLLENGKMGDILLLRGVNAYYSRNIDETYFSFREAYKQYEKKKTSRYWIKKELLIENIAISFRELNIISLGYDMSFLSHGAYSDDCINQVSGIQRTGDHKMNLPLI